MNIIKAGVIMMVYFFTLFVAYMVISTPFENMVSGFENTNTTLADAQVDAQAGYGRTAFKIAFGLAALIPFMWFLFWIFHREPDWRYRQ